MSTKPDASRRNSLQFSIKALLMIMLLVAAYFAGKIPEQRRAREAQRQAEILAQQAAVAERDARRAAEEAKMQAEEALMQARLAQLRMEKESAQSTDDGDR
jgi:hypothetical protein